ncbi:MAG: undecaprenyl-diphosphate phosphatase, partial [Lentisphaeria bacterium]
MTEVLQAVILGIVQGLTEFLPVSSSGHLEIISWLMDTTLDDNGAFNVIVHLATLLVVLIVYRKSYLELLSDGWRTLKGSNFSFSNCYRENGSVRTIFLVIITTFVTGVLGITLKDSVINMPIFGVGCGLIFTAFILWLLKFVKVGAKGIMQHSWRFALILGFVQALAILPGISRSGTTIAVALLLKSDRKFAGFYSFLILLPTVLGGSLLHLREIADINISALLCGFIAAFLSGIIALKFLLKLLDS